MADNGILILYKKVYVFIDKKIREDIPLYCSNKMYNKKVAHLDILILY